MQTPDQSTAITLLIDELGRCGVRHAVLCPGSRSAPVVLALAGDSRIESFSAIDERAAGFMALGIAKATGLPAVVSCTSGTAASNLLPAVSEAYEARIPLIVITADRPAELRASGEGQTIDQIKLFGSFASFHELAAAGHASESWWRGTACRAFGEANSVRPGPVHLNLPLREPLMAQASSHSGGRPDGSPWISQPKTTPPSAQSTVEEVLSKASRPVIVCGRDEPSIGPQASDFAHRAGIPLLADVLSGARRGSASVSCWDALLRCDGWADSHLPDLVIRTGDLPTSKPLRAWLRHACDQGATILQFDPQESWRDPDKTTSIHLTADPGETFNRVEAKESDAGWLAQWLDADAAAGSALRREILSPELGLSEPAIAADVAELLPAQAILFSSASMPLRDLDSFAPRRDEPPRVLANRGANGIDGTIASAAGAAAASGLPTFLLCGDVAFAYDVSSLSLVRDAAGPLTILLVDNDGGGIFDFLPVSEAGEDFDRFIATPPRLDAKAAAASWGIDYVEVASRTELREIICGVGPGRAPLIAHVKLNREGNVDLHKAAWQCVEAAIS